MAFMGDESATPKEAADNIQTPNTSASEASPGMMQMLASMKANIPQTNENVGELNFRAKATMSKGT